MTNETRETKIEEQTPLSFGARLQAAREELRLDCADIAAQLRLNEKIILMMEKEKFSSDLPPTFIRGYLRCYAKYLQIPDSDIEKALKPIKSEPVQYYIADNKQSEDKHYPAKLTNYLSDYMNRTGPITSRNYFMQIFTFLIVFTLCALVATWWHHHAQAVADPTQEAQITTVMNTQPPKEVTPAVETAQESAITVEPPTPAVENNNVTPIAAPETATHANTQAEVTPTPQPPIAKPTVSPKTTVPNKNSAALNQHRHRNTDIYDQDENSGDTD